MINKRCEPHPFRLLATAIVGWPVYISYLKEGSLSYADGERIYVAVDSPLGQQRNEILTQSLLTVGCSLHKGIVPAIVGRADVRQRYLVLEVERCRRLYCSRLPSLYLASLEDYAPNIISSCPQHSLKIARGSQSIPLPPVWFGAIYPLKLLKSRAEHMGPALDNNTLSQLEAQLKSLEKELLDSDDESIKDTFWKLLSSPIGKDGMLSRILKDLLDMSSSPDGQSGDSDSVSSMESVSVRLVKRLGDAANALRSSFGLFSSSVFMRHETGVHSYPEWDVETQLYKDNWVSVEEVDAYTQEPAIDPAAFKLGSNIKYQRALAGLCLNYERHRGQLFGDDIVIDRLIDLTVTLQAGCSGDDRIYQANLKTRRDLGVHILVDASSSTLEISSEGRKVCDLQMEVSWHLCRAFSQLGDRVAMYGFHSWGRKLLRFQRLKSFDERTGATIENRIKNMSVAGYTRCGAAIRHAADQLQRYSGMPCKLLLVVSDGYPYDDQYEGVYAAEDPKKALAELRGQGIACVCLSVGSDVDQQRLKSIYGDANYLSVERIEKLASQLRPVIESAISQAISHY